jgi:hypothetical protein
VIHFKFKTHTGEVSVTQKALMEATGFIGDPVTTLEEDGTFTHSWTTAGGDVVIAEHKATEVEVAPK